MCNLSLSRDPSSGSRVLHSISGEEISPIMKVTPAPTAATISTAETGRGIRLPLQIAGGRRQHGADHESRYDRKKEGFGNIEHRDDADDEQPDQGECHDLGAANDRRLFGLAVASGVPAVSTGRVSGETQAHWEGHATGSPRAGDGSGKTPTCAT